MSTLNQTTHDSETSLKKQRLQERTENDGRATAENELGIDGSYIQQRNDFFLADDDYEDDELMIADDETASQSMTTSTSPIRKRDIFKWQQRQAAVITEMNNDRRNSTSLVKASHSNSSSTNNNNNDNNSSSSNPSPNEPGGRDEVKPEESHAPTFSILGRKIVAEPTDPASRSLYGFGRSWFLSHYYDQLQQQEQGSSHASSLGDGRANNENDSKILVEKSSVNSNDNIVNEKENESSSIATGEIVSRKNEHSEALKKLVSLRYKSGTEMFESFNVNRRKVQKKKTLLNDLKRWAKERKRYYLEFQRAVRHEQLESMKHISSQQQKLQQVSNDVVRSSIDKRDSTIGVNSDEASRETSRNNESMDLLCEEEQ